jgi:hypothetical protein
MKAYPKKMGRSVNRQPGKRYKEGNQSFSLNVWICSGATTTRHNQSAEILKGDERCDMAINYHLLYQYLLPRRYKQAFTAAYKSKSQVAGIEKTLNNYPII